MNFHKQLERSNLDNKRESTSDFQVSRFSQPHQGEEVEEEEEEEDDEEDKENDVTQT